MSFEFLTFLAYSPRGKSEIEISSRTVAGSCKNGDVSFSTRLSQRIKEANLSEFFANSALVPVPRSTPLVDGAVFPAKIICETLASNGVGENVADCLMRKYAIPKSSGQFHADTRNTVQAHQESLIVDPVLFSEPTIIIVDDILTLGRTSMASALELQKVYPDKEIKIFCAIRTRSWKDLEKIIDISRGRIYLTTNGAVQLPD
ncbi:phosphoribosyltransferase [Chryseobacterium sp. 3008163]|uniref:phosphoribosyltransferase n=1 Tax=Chryseobacterium sp. 3008163 TaxID=2478663 RepID=UPI000F0CE194|nr:phosphoribosyltransferase [Chryseobacterium sp. 3008163]AYM99186.1 phosphoribosyltransferase [Chryseobacterium sp. 3008163]